MTHELATERVDETKENMVCPAVPEPIEGLSDSQELFMLNHHYYPLESNFACDPLLSDQPYMVQTPSQGATTACFRKSSFGTRSEEAKSVIEKIERANQVDLEPN